MSYEEETARIERLWREAEEESDYELQDGEEDDDGWPDHTSQSEHNSDSEEDADNSEDELSATDYYLGKDKKTRWRKMPPPANTRTRSHNIVIYLMLQISQKIVKLLLSVSICFLLMI